MSETPRVRTRFAPSPTGTLHVGNIRSAIFPWLWARHNGGDFILRIEDTDQTRFKENALAAIFDSLAWLGLDVDEGPDGPDAPPNEYFQTQRTPRYHAAAQQLLASGHGYHCYCSEERLTTLREEQRAKNLPTGYDRHCRTLTAAQRAEAEAACVGEGRKPVVRFAVPLEGKTTAQDLLRGALTVENKLLDDMILLKSDGLPTYHLGHIVDDYEMRITHALRGEEYLPTFPVHTLIYQALGWQLPIYIHLPLILDPSGKGKMAKRKQNPDGSTSENLTMLHEFREAGYVPEAMFNFIALLGWAVAPDRDIATVEEMIEKFDVADIKKSPAAFNYEKLDFMNGYYIRHLAVEDLAKRVVPFLEAAGLSSDHERLVEVLPLVHERMKRLTEAPELLDFFLGDAPAPNVDDLPGKNMDVETTLAALASVRAALADIPWTMEAIEDLLRHKADELELRPGQLFQPIRVALTGRTQAPGIFETVYYVGRDAVLARLDRALELLQRVEN